MIAPPPPCTDTPGTEVWARWQLANAFTEDTDRKAITDVVAAGLVPHPSLSRARMHYAMACHARGWQGWQARLAWACVEALLKDPLANDDNIPF